jgi:Ribosomal protein L21e
MTAHISAFQPVVLFWPSKIRKRYFLWLRKQIPKTTSSILISTPVTFYWRLYRRLCQVQGYLIPISRSVNANRDQLGYVVWSEASSCCCSEILWSHVLFAQHIVINFLEMPHSFGYRAHTRTLFKKPFKTNGRCPTTIYLRTFKVNPHLFHYYCWKLSR